MTEMLIKLRFTPDHLVYVYAPVMRNVKVGFLSERSETNHKH